MIHLYDIGNENFTKNGNVILQAISGTHRQAAGGNYDLTMVCPIDPEGKWRHIVPGAIVKVPVPTEVIANSFSGYDADIYKTNTKAELREDKVAPATISYTEWSDNAAYQVGDKVTVSLYWRHKNYECTYFDGENPMSMVPPYASSWWKEIPDTTSGAAVLVTLPAGTELYYVEEASSTWYKMSTYYGLEGYIEKSKVTFDRHVSASENKPRVIKEQLFRLKEPAVDNEKHTVTVTGQHVSYDLAGDIIKDVNISQAAPAMALGRLMEGLMIPYRGTIATDLTGDDAGTYTGDLKGKNGMFALLDPDKGIVSTFGAKMTRDNWDLFVMEKTETDRGYTIRYGVNAGGISWKKSSANLVNRIVPVAKDAGGYDLYLPEKWVDSENISDYPVIIMERLQVQGQVGKDKGTGDGSAWTESDLLDEMRTKAQERFSTDKADQIAEEVTIRIEMLENTAEYAWLKGMKDLLLYDTVTAEDERLGLSKKLYVSEIEYDFVKEKITAVKLSNTMDTKRRNVTGYNVANNSIGPEKLTRQVRDEILQEAVGLMPEYAYPESERPGINSASEDGLVQKGQGQAGKVWKTDAQGNPAWRDESGSVSVTDSDPTLAWGTRSKVAEVAGTDIHVTMPGNPNTDHYDWSDITNKPDTATRWPSWSEVTEKPSSFYTLPLAANGTRGGAQVGFSTDAVNRNYAVLLSGEKMYVNVPWANTEYSAGAGLALSGTTFMVNVPRVAESANTSIPLNTFSIKENQNGANYYLPSNAWYHILTVQGLDANYSTQLALGMTALGAYYRKYQSGSWSAWQSLINTDHYDWSDITNKPANYPGGCTGNAATATKATQDGNGDNIANTYLPLKTGGGLGTAGGGGSNLYFKLATITISNAYINYPIVFEVSRRGFGYQRIILIFQNSNSTDPNYSIFATDGFSNAFYLKKESTSTWCIYGAYSEKYGNCTVHRITGNGFANGVTVTLNLENIGNTAPTGVHQLTHWFQAVYADEAGSVAWGNVSGRPTALSGLTNDLIQVGNVRGTTNANGNMYTSFTSATIILAAWASIADAAVTPFLNQGYNEHGGTQWYFHVTTPTAANPAKASTAMTIYYAYIRI